MESFMLEVGGGARAETGRGSWGGDGGQRQSEGVGLSFQGPDRDWVTSAIKCCMNIQEFPNGQAEGRIGNGRTDEWH